MNFVRIFLILSCAFLCTPTLLASDDYRAEFMKQYENDESKKNDPCFTRVCRTINCPDSDYIPKVNNAGQIIDYKGQLVQVMHNGIMIHLHSYCEGERWNTSWMTDIIKGLRGSHEPQEEKAFHEILKTLKPNAVMLELGCWWAYYSMWFNKAIPNAVNYLIEPNNVNLGLGKANFKLNSMRGDFTYAYLGEKVDLGIGGINKEAPKLSIDAFMKVKNIAFLDILHADIQGGELKMLHGAKDALDNQKIHYLFISTHGAEIGIGEKQLHQKCLQFLKEHNYHIVCEHSTAESCSIDGLIVARAQSIPGIDHIELSKYNYNW